MEGGRWITARFKGRCRRCGRTVYPGDRILHFRYDRKVACRACGGD
jgi:DNA-directed RNA polymerase subunit RPC12/RpoP